jgi:hypothetical protein
VSPLQFVGILLAAKKSLKQSPNTRRAIMNVERVQNRAIGCGIAGKIIA